MAKQYGAYGVHIEPTKRQRIFGEVKDKAVIGHHGPLCKGFIMNSYIKENFDTGFLSPRINFAIFCASFALGALGIIFGAYL